MPGPRGPRGPKPKIKNPGKLFARLMGFIFKKYLPACIIVVICIFVSVLANVQGTMFTKNLIDDYIVPLLKTGNPDYGPLLAAMGRVAVFYGIGVISTFAYSKIMIYVSQGTIKNLRVELFSHMQDLPIRYFDSHAHGDIMSIYTNDIDTLRQLISQSLPQILNSAITVVSVFVSMVILNIPLTILTIVMVIVTTVVTKKFAGFSSRYFLAQQRDLGKVNGFIEEMLNGQKVVKVFTHEQENIEAFDKINDELFESAYNANMYSNMLGPVNAQIGNLSYVLCALAGGVMALSGFGGLTLGKLASFLTFNKSFNMPISQVSQQFNSIIMALAGCDRIFSLLDEAPETDEGYVTLVNAKEENGKLTETPERTGLWAWKHTHQADGSVDYKKLEGDVVFDDVDFGYVPEKIVLHDVDLFATPGQKIAFVGTTGAGKTTITNLINRFYDIADGKIRYDGININKIKKADLRHSLGIVLQDTHLFTATVMENIRYGKLDATDDEVYAAARLANADTFIRQLPDGYNTVLTGDGANLSQGQRQLLAIARAAIADPPVLILDEATSSIDTRTERIVQDGMDKLMHGRTTFVIAHRLSTVRNSDCIMVLEHGRIIERGSHDELISKKGKYYQLYTGKTA
ncbi:ABC transporter ATP-binding protein [Agathobacter rectalis]|uniref:ABC transporter ATP-binding protein/permease n=1 Tax=Agathobacter rectalis TaxID=39491 RepID=A0AAW4WRJ6_9FIRM|nr:ABC transporter ATP-binding protein [Agathobacter rectalis]MCC2747290.1 ABC transporter ATP-binding protein/permease [Agathobacter rectalis]NSI36351.1 ABC transporter ATP-binding protein [Agathobacter rectalis]NSI39625.1 ABC transporter ATP-binding protein [Agathobacter rectalis]NSI69064.1 ABC transporter ATP-binding protein [Agathobacter rectalis]NSI74959.1 ABC transporter ATP-binding protein [Agathobacter rectalis]